MWLKLRSTASVRTVLKHDLGGNEAQVVIKRQT
jgi:hypothetical protein